MNGMLIQLVASGAALSLMGSAVTVHYVHVKELTSPAADAREMDGLQLVTHEVRTEGLPGRDSKDSSEAAGQAGSMPREEEVTLEILQSIANQLESLSRENERLRSEQSELVDQLAEANRDLSQLQFRVDTHSESFRPLRVGEDSLLRELTPSHSILPPKDWTSRAGASGWQSGGQ